MLATVGERSVEEPRSTDCWTEIHSLTPPSGCSAGWMPRLQAGGKNLDSGTASWVTGRIALSAASDIYTLGYICYIPIDWQPQKERETN